MLCCCCSRLTLSWGNIKDCLLHLTKPSEVVDFLWGTKIRRNLIGNLYPYGSNETRPNLCGGSGEKKFDVFNDLIALRHYVQKIENFKKSTQFPLRWIWQTQRNGNCVDFLMGGPKDYLMNLKCLKCNGNYVEFSWFSRIFG